MIYINMFKIMLTFLTLIFLFMMNLTLNLNFQMIVLLNETMFNMYENVMFIFDIYSMSFFLVISIVVFNVLSFMNMYMYMNKNMKTFFFMTKMFILSMFLLVYSFNLWTMIIGWEGLGVSSFYLIFYYNNYESWKSAIKTFVNNKIGDCLLITSMIFMVLFLNSFKMTSMMFLISMFTKSAQYPFMAWLPMAMAAPTPISAMVHSSTLVTAGLFIMFRLFNNFYMKINLNFFMNLCLISMLVSGMKAITEKDMKKMIALSTLSQMSLIFFFLLNNMKNLAFIYMCNHAFFKSLMFINMGMMMMNNFSSQLKFNMTNFNLISKFLLSYKIACFNLMNLSFFSSFFVKEKMLMTFGESMASMTKFLVFLFNSFLTMNYSMKMIFFFNKNNHKSKFNSLICFTNYNMSFFLMNIFSIIFSKIVMNMFLFTIYTNLLVMMIYLISLMVNFKIFENNFIMINSIMYLNYMLYMYSFKVMKYSLEFNELWMEKFTLNFYFFLKNKMLNKTFNMNYNLIMMMFLMIMFI
uniref:NADH:ubiquinone reductase (H(+)-translocating) n=1 Tax=Tetranychus phaselus TaxID=381747 RepID=A0A075XF33_TETPE|nr:NADH dehydrogenase subunit 5 [Tetranychus phaselus]AIH15689.1 NADH dehydrogenase subunit 5 [Tetranychus phaselus]